MYRPINSLDELLDGAVQEKFVIEFNRVLKNALDPNTNAKAKRRVRIDINVIPNNNRDAAEFIADVTSKIAPHVPVSKTVMLHMTDTGNVIATEQTNQIPGQVTMEGEVIMPKVIEFNER